MRGQGATEVTNNDVINNDVIKADSDNGSDASEFYSGEKFRISGRSESGSWSSSERGSVAEEASRVSGAGSLEAGRDNRGFVEDDVGTTGEG